jgi:hypothetical protein
LGKVFKKPVLVGNVSQQNRRLITVLDNIALVQLVVFCG